MSNKICQKIYLTHILRHSLVHTIGELSDPGELQLKHLVLHLVVHLEINIKTVSFTTCLITLLQIAYLIDDLGSFLDELCTGHLGHLDLLQLRLGRRLRLASSAAPVA